MLTQTTNRRIFTPQGWSNEGPVLMRDGEIPEVTNCDLALVGANLVGARGVYIVPGFVCMHAHGGGGHDFTGCTEETLYMVIAAHMKRGAISFFPTLSLSPFSEVHKAVDICEKLIAESDSPILDLHMKGPYLNRKMAGEQLADQVKRVDVAEYTSLLESTDCIKRWGAPPELPGAFDFARYLKLKGTVGVISYTEAEYDSIKEAYEAGFTRVTHFYNVMPGFHKRREYKYEGTVESVYLTDSIAVGLIAGGIHLPSTVLEPVYKLKGVEHTCLVTDAPSYVAAEGKATDDSRTIIEDGVRKLADRSALVGSIATVGQLVCTVAKTDIPLADTIRMASGTPARIMGTYDREGPLQKDKDADILVLNRNLNIKAVWVMGRLVRES